MKNRSGETAPTSTVSFSSPIPKDPALAWIANDSCQPLPSLRSAISLPVPVNEYSFPLNVTQPRSSSVRIVCGLGVLLSGPRIMATQTAIVCVGERGTRRTGVL